MLAIYAGICYNKYNRKTPEHKRKGDFTMTINSKCYSAEQIARDFFQMQAPANVNAHCMDGINEKGETLEVKTFFSSRPSLGGAYVLKNTNNIRQAVTDYCKATFYAFFVEEDKPLYFTKAEAIEWLLERVVLDKMASNRGGHYKLKIGKNPRTQKQTNKFIAAGFIL